MRIQVALPKTTIGIVDHRPGDLLETIPIFCSNLNEMFGVFDSISTVDTQ